MISTPGTDPPRSVAVLGTGLMGTSIALAATRAQIAVTGWDADPAVASVASGMGALEPADDLAAAVAGADLIVVCTPLATVADVVAAALDAAPDAVVTDVGSVKEAVLRDVAARRPGALARYVPGHPMGGGERTGPERASASVVDAIVWVLAPGPRSAPESVGLVEAFVSAVGARPVLLDPERHDRLVAFVSHLPQVASTSLMGLAATEEAGEPGIDGPVLVGEGCELDGGARLDGPLVIGDGAAVAAGAFVKHSILLPGAQVPAGAIVAGAIYGRAGALA